MSYYMSSAEDSGIYRKRWISCSELSHLRMIQSMNSINTRSSLMSCYSINLFKSIMSVLKTRMLLLASLFALNQSSIWLSMCL